MSSNTGALQPCNTSKNIIQIGDGEDFPFQERFKIMYVPINSAADESLKIKSGKIIIGSDDSVMTTVDVSAYAKSTN